MTDAESLPEGRLIDRDLLGRMQCPNDGGVLNEDFAASYLVCATCGFRYSVIDGIPNMLVDEAIPPDAVQTD
jgi:uncharacterized protein YbaR (Trm112 family)